MNELACPKCRSNRLVKFGKKWYQGVRNQQYLCNNCGKITIHPIQFPRRDNKGRFIPHIDINSPAGKREQEIIAIDNQSSLTTTTVTDSL